MGVSHLVRLGKLAFRNCLLYMNRWLVMRVFSLVENAIGHHSISNCRTFIVPRTIRLNFALLARGCRFLFVDEWAKVMIRRGTIEKLSFHRPSFCWKSRIHRAESRRIMRCFRYVSVAEVNLTVMKLWRGRASQQAVVLIQYLLVVQFRRHLMMRVRYLLLRLIDWKLLFLSLSLHYLRGLIYRFEWLNWPITFWVSIEMLLHVPHVLLSTNSDHQFVDWQGSFMLLLDNGFLLD